MTFEIPRLFKLRAAVGRYGEMDGAGWWNTQGVLGPRGATLYKRGMPRTHLVTRVRLVSRVARLRSSSVYPAPDAATLWALPPQVERALAFEERSWAAGQGNGAQWEELEAALSSPPSGDLVEWLISLGLVEASIGDRLRGLAPAPGGKGVEVPGPVTPETIQLLAAAHALGGPKELVVPFVAGGIVTDDSRAGKKVAHG